MKLNNAPFQEPKITAPVWIQWFNALVNLINTPPSGITSARPSNVPVGYYYFDTTLEKPIWWKGSVWVDATGATV